MKKYRFILFALIFTLFCGGSCKYEEGQRFIIQNNSEQEVMIVNAWYSSITPGCIKPTTKVEYEDFIHSRMIKPRSEKNFERNKFAEYMMEHPNTILYFGVFYRIDMDTMSCEEFKQKFPLKKEWKVTLADMEACDWTLVYP